MRTNDNVTYPENELSAETAASVLMLGNFMREVRRTINTNQSNPLTQHYTAALKNALLTVFKEADFTPAITGTGIPAGSSFADETIRILKGKILPYLHNPKEAQAIIHEIFDNSKDHARIEKLLLTYPAFTDWFTKEEKNGIMTAFSTQVTNSIRIISHRIAALGMDEDVYIRSGKDDALITPFIEQNHEVTELLKNIEKGNTEKVAEDLAQCRIMIQHCLDNIAVIDKGAEKNGTSLRQTFLLRKLELLIGRLNMLLPVICYDDGNQAFADLMNLLCQIVLAETKRQKLRDFVSRNINLIAYRITENKRKTGEHYIASGKAEYWDLFIAACGGGFIVSFMVIIKLMIHKMHLPLLWESLLYSLNYATGFVVVQMLNFSIATKQPAMTAATIAASLDDIKDDASRYHHLAAMVARVSRSQLVSFAGNLLIVFPCAMLWIYALCHLGGQSLVDEESANELLMNVHPIHSPLFWYASIAGAALFLAGVISGFGDNKVVVSKIGLRLEAHPFLKKIFSAETRHKLASYIDKNLGGLLGNISVGFMLGMAGFFGKITGLPFDIRHVTFSTGNVALGLYGPHDALTGADIFAILSGLFIIGLFNFAVSFFLAFQVAVRSRGLRLSDYPDVMAAVLIYFKKHPARFFYPEQHVPKQQTISTE